MHRRSRVKQRASSATRWHAGILAAAVCLLVAPSVLAHAFLERASPAVGSTIRAAPAEIALRFTENLEPAFSTVSVTGPDGARVDSGEVRVDPSEPMVLRASLKKLAPGSYNVVWRVVSVDTHVTEGDFRFTVAP
jgi:copper resistance protein C